MTAQLGLFGGSVSTAAAAPPWSSETRVRIKSTPAKPTGVVPVAPPNPTILPRFARAATDPNPRAPRPFVGEIVECELRYRCDVCGNWGEPGVWPYFAVECGEFRAHLGCGRGEPMTRIGRESAR